MVPDVQLLMLAVPVPAHPACHQKGYQLIEALGSLVSGSEAPELMTPGTFLFSSALVGSTTQPIQLAVVPVLVVSYGIGDMKVMIVLLTVAEAFGHRWICDVLSTLWIETFTGKVTPSIFGFGLVFGTLTLAPSTIPG